MLEKFTHLLEKIHLSPDYVQLKRTNDEFSIYYLIEDTSFLSYFQEKYSKGQDIFIKKNDLGFSIQILGSNDNEIWQAVKNNGDYEIEIDNQTLYFYNWRNLLSDNPFSFDFMLTEFLNDQYNLADIYRGSNHDGNTSLRYISKRKLDKLKLDTISIKEHLTYNINCSIRKDFTIIPKYPVKLIPEVDSIISHYQKTLNSLFVFLNETYPAIDYKKSAYIDTDNSNNLMKIHVSDEAIDVEIVPKYLVILKDDQVLKSVLFFIKDNFKLFDHPVFLSFFKKLDPYLKRRFEDAYSGTISEYAYFEWYCALFEIQEI